jgi:ribosomal protein S18 acetylase RimI-like enzyme
MTEILADMHEQDKTSVIIERAVPGDATAIMTLKRDAWLGAYVSEENGISEEDIRKKFSDQTLAEGIANWEKGIATETGEGERVTYVAKMNGEVVGYTSPCIEDGQRRIGAMYVAPASQGSGVGGKLMQKALEWHGLENDVYLHVVSYNQGAIGFYEHYGFQKTGKVFQEGFDKEQDIKLLPEIEMVRKGQPA